MTFVPFRVLPATGKVIENEVNLNENVPFLASVVETLHEKYPTSSGYAVFVNNMLADPSAPAAHVQPGDIVTLMEIPMWNHQQSR